MHCAAPTQIKDVSVIILSGAAPSDCSPDLKALQKISNASVAENLEDARSFNGTLHTDQILDRPVIAAVKGRALAGGCGLATAATLFWRHPAFCYPEVKIGFCPAMVMAILRPQRFREESV